MPDSGAIPAAVDVLPQSGCLKKVLVVGAGVAGLITARQLQRLGLQVLVVEATDDVGGVWTRNYDSYGLQVPWRQYQFPEFLWPKDIQPKDEYPSGQQVHAYIKAYAQHFGLMKHVYLNCKLVRLRWSSATCEWEALYNDTVTDKFYKTRVDYVVICSGLYSHPYIPDVKGADAFAGARIHSRDFTDMSAASGKRVVIVGAGKTALDCVCGLVASRTAASVTMLYRQLHYPVPRRVWGVSVRSLLFNRALPAMLPPYYTDGPGARAADAALRLLKRLFWRSLECTISRKFQISSDHRPRIGLPGDLFYGGQILDDSNKELLRCETFAAVKGEIVQFMRDGVVLQDGTLIPTDLVLYCTGYAKTYEYFDGETRSRLGLQKDGLYLYRNCLPCGVPHLAFVGSEVSTYSNILTHTLQALWLAHVLSGRVKLPSPAAMVADVRAQQQWRRKVMPPQRNRGATLMLYGMRYHDQLLQDMGFSPRRKGLNLLGECFGAYSAGDYSSVVARELSMAVPAAAEAAAGWEAQPEVDTLGSADAAAVVAAVEADAEAKFVSTTALDTSFEGGTDRAGSCGAVATADVGRSKSGGGGGATAAGGAKSGTSAVPPVMVRPGLPAAPAKAARAANSGAAAVVSLVLTGAGDDAVWKRASPRKAHSGVGASVR